jgi:hypothetical protein
MSDLPQLALSVRQPWAWAIIHAGKDIENRSWQAVNHGLRRRGRIAVHASKGLGKEEYESARDFIDAILAARPGNGLRCPAAIDLKRGGIVGSVEATPAKPPQGVPRCRSAVRRRRLVRLLWAARRGAG